MDLSTKVDASLLDGLKNRQKKDKQMDRKLSEFRFNSLINNISVNSKDGQNTSILYCTCLIKFTYTQIDTAYYSNAIPHHYCVAEYNNFNATNTMTELFNPCHAK